MYEYLDVFACLPELCLVLHDKQIKVTFLRTHGIKFE